MKTIAMTEFTGGGGRILLSLNLHLRLQKY